MKEYLQKCLFFSYLTPEQLDKVSSSMDQVELPKGKALFTEGEMGDYACFVLDGTLEVIKSSIFGEANNIATLVLGNSIGEMALVDGSARSATVRSLGDSRLAVLTKTSFDKIVDNEPMIGINILKGLALVLSDNLRETSNLLSDEMK